MNAILVDTAYPAASLKPPQVLSARGLHVESLAGIEIVKGFDFNVAEGEIAGIVGPSGSGKTLATMALCDLLPATVQARAGSLCIGGAELAHARGHARRRLISDHVGVIFQDPTASLNSRLTIGAHFDEVLATSGLKESRTRRRERAADLLSQVGIAAVRKTLDAHPHALSGGLNQRVCIALALARDPKVLIADEPTTALDVSVQAKILDLLLALRSARGLAIVLVSHDINVVAELVDTVHVMAQGRIVESGPVAQVLAAPRHEQTRMLLECQPHKLLVGRQAATLPAEQLAQAGAPLFQVEGVSKSFVAPGVGALGRQPHLALDQVSLMIHAGQALGLVGESGSGKTTLARIIAGLTAPDAGTVVYGGEQLAAMGRQRRSEWRRDVQYVFQNPYAALDPRMTVEQILREPLELNGGMRDAQEIDKTIRRLLDEVEISPLYRVRRPRELSGGQCQRIGIARALANDPRVLIADEPVSALDLSVQAKILQLLAQLRRDRQLTYLLISHDLEVVSLLCDEVAVMTGGRIVEQGPTDEVFTRPQHEYTRRLIQAIPGRNLQFAIYDSRNET
jgi:peptide/nickel transport system ATP-binding protein